MRKKRGGEGRGERDNVGNECGLLVSLRSVVTVGCAAVPPSMIHTGCHCSVHTSVVESKSNAMS